MLKHLINFYKVSSLGPCNEDVMSSSGKRRLKYLHGLPFFRQLSDTVCIMSAG